LLLKRFSSLIVFFYSINKHLNDMLYQMKGFYNYLNIDLMVALAVPAVLSYWKFDIRRSMAQPRSSTSWIDVSVSSKAKQRRTKISNSAENLNTSFNGYYSNLNYNYKMSKCYGVTICCDNITGNFFLYGNSLHFFEQ